MSGGVVYTLLFGVLLLAGDMHMDPLDPVDAGQGDRADSFEVRLLAVGDMNLGRRLGRVLLTGDTLAPFQFVRDTLQAFDVVFGNLECPVSEQGGVTEHPRNNIIFTAPPVAAWSLARGGLDIVSTANNHVMDFGVTALHETRMWLDSAGVAHVGTSADRARLYEPTVLTRNGIRMAFFACTEFVNDDPGGWREVVAAADTAALFPRMRIWRDSVDFLIVSIHGGQEYTDKPGRAMQEFGRAAVDAGADLVLGHHPHVPHGVERYRGGWIVHSLGNFVFRQPGRFWTQHGIALSLTLSRREGIRRMENVRILPVRSDFRPAFVQPGPDYDKVLARVRALSTKGTEESALW
jgi:poly-gamma-glutamate synthesis protein (capsule biosynthesis protein)